MARVARSTSAETSRLAARNVANRSSKSALLSVQANGHGGFLGRRVEGLCSMARRPMAVNPLEPSFRDGPQDQTQRCHCTPGIRDSPVRKVRTDVDAAHRPGMTGRFTPPARGARWRDRWSPRSSVPRSVSSHSRHSTSSRSAPPWLNSRMALPPGASPGWNSIPTSSSIASGASRSMLRDLQASTRSKRNAAIERRGAVPPDSVCSQSSRFIPTTSRFSSCRQTMSDACTRASCTWAEITARSSASSAINLSCSGAGIPEILTFSMRVPAFAGYAR